MNEKRWKCCFVNLIAGGGDVQKLLSDPYDWLVERGHSGQIYRYETPGDYAFEIEFDDHRLAMLFKLTWL